MNMKRLTLATLAALATALTIGSAQAQQAAKVYRVGALFNRVPGPEFEVLKTELARLGYVEGTNIVFEARFAEGKLDRLPGFARRVGGRTAVSVDDIDIHRDKFSGKSRKSIQLSFGEAGLKNDIRPLDIA